MRDSPKNFHNKILGRKGETLTCKYLKRHGYKILKRNYATPFGEADIVAFKNGYYCFVEVKMRASDVFGLPSEAVNREKQRRYRMIAKYFCTERREELPCRYDVSSVCGDELEYFEDAFI